MASPKKLRNVHPGEVLQAEFLRPLRITVYRLAKEIRVPATRIAEIVHGRRSITADTALRLSRYFGTSERFWLGLQQDYDLEEGRRTHAHELSLISRLKGKIRIKGDILSTGVEWEADAES